MKPASKRLIKKARGHGQAGFSLLEMLIALAIMSLTSVALFQSIGTMLNVSDRAVNASERTVEARIAQQTISALIDGLVEDWSEDTADTFEGKFDQFSGVSANTIHSTRPENARFTMSLEQSTEGSKDLVYASGAYNWVLDTALPSTASFEYMGPDKLWYKNWPPILKISQNQDDVFDTIRILKLPTAIRVNTDSRQQNIFTLLAAINPYRIEWILDVSKTSEQGFVLPYVLAVIAILATATSIAAIRLQNSTDILGKMQDQSRTERILISAEAEATYALLTGIPVEHGIDLNPNSAIVSEFGVFTADGGFKSSAAKKDEIKRDLWEGYGGIRLSSQKDGEAYIELRDIAGLVSLTSGRDDDIINVLAALEVSKNTARGLLAKLRDYSDLDNKRQFKGAERADYRLRDRPPPTNSPLRNFDELASIIGWDDVITEMNWDDLKSMTTLHPNNLVKPAYASPDLLKVLNLDERKEPEIPTTFNMDNLDALNPIISDTSRISIWVRKADGTYHSRVIEIQRAVNNIEKPFRRFWVYETTVLENDLKLDIESTKEIKNVIHAASDRVR